MAMSAMSANVSKGLFDFALPYAVKLAEAGQSLPEKRVGMRPLSLFLVFLKFSSGYVFCAELMPAGHEMYLMLINTIRKARINLQHDRSQLIFVGRI